MPPGLNPVTTPDARAYRSIDPLETRGSSLYSNTAPPGRNGFMGDNSGTNRLAGDSNFLYANFQGNQPDGTGQGEYCVYWTLNPTNVFTPNPHGWNDYPATANFRFMCMDIPGGW